MNQSSLLCNQTVVCFPFFGGVVELGVTKLVSEDLGLVHHIRTCLSDMPHNFFNMETVVTPVIMEEVESQTKSSDEVRQVEAVGDELKMEESIHGEVLQAGSCFHLMEDDLSNCIYSSMTSSDCMSQTFFHPNNIISTSPKAENTDDTRDNTNNAKFEYLELQQGDEDMHYQNVLSSLFKTSHTLMLRPSIQDRYKESSFVCWRKLGTQAIRQPQDQIIPQRMLKKILLQVPRLHNDISLSKTGELGGERLDVIFRPEADETHVNHVNERFSSLESLIPLTSKADEVSILDDTIVYLKELERRVEELESCQDVSEHAKRKPDQDMVERTSDYYHQHNSKAGGSKRKASDLDEGMQETSHVSFTDASCENISITMIDKDILIEIKCPWRHYLLLEIIDMLSNLHLDSYSVQSSNIDGILFLTMKSKLRGLIGISAGMIRQALQRVLQKCGIP
ncbi:endoglucanase 3 [Dionaea muscipula]